MPELPEVETTRRDLSALCVGASLTRVQLPGVRTVRRGLTSEKLEGRLVGLAVEGVERLGKYLIFRLKDQNATGFDGRMDLVVHLGMSGRFLRSNEQRLARHVAGSFRFEGSRLGVEESLWFYDPRTFGEIFLSQGRVDYGITVELAHLGFDLVSDVRSCQFRKDRLVSLFRSTSPIKARLLDQRYLAGLGNIYSDEVLFRTRIHPRRSANSLELGERKQLVQTAATVLREAIKHRGSSLADTSYRDLNGDIGSYQRLHQAYGRSGEPCVRCGERMTKETIVGRSSTFCPLCQGRW